PSDQVVPHDPRRGSRERGEGDRGAEQPRDPRRGAAAGDGPGGLGGGAGRLQRRRLHRPPLKQAQQSSPQPTPTREGFGRSPPQGGERPSRPLSFPGPEGGSTGRYP